MEGRDKKNTLFLAIIGLAVTLVLMGTATYAGFTSNNDVATNVAYGKSGTASLKFLMGPDEGSLTEVTSDGVEIGQVNTAAKDAMFPVTTADLEKFLYADKITPKGAEHFTEDTNEARFYHGRLYIRLEGENIAEGSEYNLYLDTSDDAGGVMGVNTDGGHVLNGARLGLKFSEGDKSIIFKFDEENKGAHEINTIVNGKLIEAGQVLDSSGNPVTDPAEEFKKYSLNSSEDIVELPEAPLTTLTVNNTVPVDIYFYLEGCDEDCVSEISKQECDIHLAFYAIAASE